MTNEEIREHFEQYGAIIDFEIPFDKAKNQRKGFGFITFEREETMKELIKQGKVTIGAHHVDLRKATPKPDHGQFYRGGPGGFYGDYYGYGGYYGGGGGAGGGYGGYQDYYMGGWDDYSAGYYGMSPGGGKMRGGGGGGGSRGGASKRGGTGAPY